MKTIIKVLILLCVSVGAIAAVILLAEHLQDPIPADTPIISFNDFCEGKISDYKSAKSGNIFKAFDNITNVDSIMTAESLIDTDTHNANLSQIADAFSSRLKKWSYEKFNASEWFDADLEKMQAYCNKVLKIGNLSASASGNVNSVVNVLDKYNKATACANKTGYYYSNPGVVSDFNEINKFLNDTTLMRNTRLTERLKSKKVSIAHSHYNKVSNKINNISRMSRIDLGDKSTRDKLAVEMSDLLLDLREMEPRYTGLSLGRSEYYNELKNRWEKVRSDKFQN